MEKKNMEKKKVVQVCWIDSTMLGNAQVVKDELKKDIEDMFTPIYSFGFIASEDKDQITIARDSMHDSSRGVLIIPKCAVISIEQLELGENLFFNKSLSKLKDNK